MKNFKLLSSSLFMLLFASSLFAQRNSNFYPEEGVYYSIKIKGKFVTVMGQAKGETNVGLSSTNKGDAQLFRFIPEKNGAHYLIETKLKKGIYLTVDWSRTKPNTNIKLNPRKNDNQYFRFMNAGNGMVIHTKLAMNVFLGSNASDDNVVIQDYKNQGIFDFYAADGAGGEVKPTPAPAPEPDNNSTASIDTDKTYNLQVKKSKQYLDVYSSSKANKAKIGQYGETNNANQAFQFKNEGNGFYSIKAVHSGKVIEVSTKQVGSAVYQNAYSGKASQLFSLEDKGNGYYAFRNKDSKSVLDIKGNGELTHWSLHGGPNQLFKLVTTTVKNTPTPTPNPKPTPTPNPSSNTGTVTMINTAESFTVDITKDGDDSFSKSISAGEELKISCKVGDNFRFTTGEDGWIAFPYKVRKTGVSHKIVVGERYSSGKGQKLPNTEASRYSYDLLKIDPIFIDYDGSKTITNAKGNSVGKGGMRKAIFKPLKNDNIDWNNEDGDYAVKNHFTYNVLMETRGKNETKMFYSSSAYEKSFSANIGASTPKGGGSASFSHTSSNSSSETSIYTYSRTKVKAYDVKLKPEAIALTDEFKRAVKNLPKTYSKSAYSEFIKTWGSHYPTTTTYGGMQVVTYKFDAKEIMESEGMAVGVEGNMKMASAGGGYSENESFKNKQENAKGMYFSRGGSGNGDSYEVDFSSSVPVDIKLTRLYVLFDAKHFNDGTTYAELKPRRANLKKALLEYLGSVTDNGRSLKPRMYKISDVQWKVKKDDYEVYGKVEISALKNDKRTTLKKVFSRSDADGSRVTAKRNHTEKCRGEIIVSVAAENGKVDPSQYAFRLYADLTDDVWDGDEKIGKKGETMSFDKLSKSGQDRITLNLSSKIEVSAKVKEIDLGFDD